ncbi:hypothetical protein UA75_25505 [Actinoalloteichus sp. GBA129-24]|uniref:Uncharacterized protein n=1 Tax=Actinoalloteichus fjordicus TaxID=1612552 RepID=A0AAC9PTT0_9PSEU|nr:hypothetical protein UA74_24925 [Actinoalloteichus fjordicus]APU23079.1 hypothetical protein UA75_25505 [Actinoalloteichus sp. GBA129-24]
MLFDGVLRWWERLRSRRRARRIPPLDVDDPRLVVVVEAFDPAEADSAALARSERWDAERQAVLRHHLRLPAASRAQAADLLAEEGWLLREQAGHPVGEDASASTAEAPASQAAPGDLVALEAVRVQLLDALHCAQARSRMAGLAARLGGDALGWDALQV